MDIIRSVLDSLHFNSTLFWIQILTFTVFHWVMKAILYGPLEKVRNQRDAEIQAGLRVAEAVNREALEFKSRYEAGLLAARQEAQKLVSGAVEQAEKERAARVAAAREEAARRMAEVQAQVERDRAQALAELEQKVRELALRAATRLVSQAVEPAEAERLSRRLSEVAQ
ncbi:MAG TPA: ATP synthase F0 subunit B [Candidatus Nitrosotenuis sp.]|jgi:ATP synthase F0 subunit b|nr:ATP synthase F0 subunit B [Candidatus Nitrosotenuis sp.]